MNKNNLIFTFGNKYKAEISGSSHDDMIKTVIRGLPSCFEIDLIRLRKFLGRRAPGTNPVSSGRMEKDDPVLLSGGRINDSILITDGTPLILAIKNTDVRRKDYCEFSDTPRPGHADFTAQIRYPGMDMSGGGPFSGRMTAPLCIAGGIAIQFLEQYGITIGAHIASIGTVSDKLLDPAKTNKTLLDSLNSSFFPVLSDDFEKKARTVIAEAAENKDSVGGVVEVAACGVPAGIGGAMNQGMESIIAHSMFGIPAVKGIEFGSGFAGSKLKGSENNDSFVIEKTAKSDFVRSDCIRTVTNNHGGILGGITSGMPLICRVAFKPTPSIGRYQRTVNLRSMKSEDISVSGRHDPCFAPRAVPVCEAVLAISLLDTMLSQTPTSSVTKPDATQLETLRDEIDNIDDKLLDLFMARMSLSSKIADYKKEKGLPVRNVKREQEVLKNICKKSDGFLSAYSREFFTELMRLSRNFQEEKLQESNFDCSADFCRKNIQYGLLGRKLSHSYSKTIHEMIGLYDYELMPMEPDDIDSLMKSRAFKGLNVTIPYKQTVIPFCDRLTPLAKKINAVNTLFFDADGKLCGGNTDYTGFLAASSSAGLSYNGKNILIMGTGATSLTVYHAVKDSGASKITFAGRSIPEKWLLPDADYITFDSLFDSKSDYHNIEIIINTTPVGMYPENNSSLITLDHFPDCTGVFDVVYNPFMTDLLLQAKDLGIPYANGLKMLVGQALASSILFTGASSDEPEPETLFDSRSEAIFLKLKKQLENIVLIGMPGCGKTTIGKMLSDTLGKSFLDTDSEIEKSEKMTIPDLFSEKGEKHFRNAETVIVTEAGKNNSQIISTGGGTVLRKENMDALRQNGIIIWLQRPTEKLATSGRPLSSSPEALKKIYAERKSLYSKYADISVNVLDDARETLKLLLSALNSISD